ncbi:DUF6520 family protein [Salegentibacter sp. UBA1130]|uniref:DUF6520 family protein n=1 Tax=Salegentibacter sp. UBA1130 TaxID=1947451 RepID=UPI00257F4E2F|nr:DUF6520 family protein [Salegentibacter sp. UBA1130]
MNLRKFILPMMAFIFAIGMSFATVGLEADPQNDYIQRNGTWEAIPEQDCGMGEETCQVIKAGEGPFTLYDAQNLSSVKKGGGDYIVLP